MVGPKRAGTTSALVFSVLLMAPGNVHAASSSGCAAANRGSLNQTLGAGATTSRQVRLDSGDTLALSASGATVSVNSGDATPLALIGGAGSTAYKAPATADYTFIFEGTQAAGTVSVSCISAQAEAANSEFLNRRKSLLTAREPDRLRIDRAPTPIANPDKPLGSSVGVDDQGRARNVEFSVSLSELQAASKGSSKIEPGLVDFWLEGRMQNYDSVSAVGAGGGNLGVLYLGTRTMFGPDIMLGALAQLDRGLESAKYDEAEFAAKGWMFGPYVSMKLGSGIVFDGRAAWGETQNAVAGTEIDNSHTGRRLMRGKLTGTRDYQGWKVAPSIGLVYVEDTMRDASTGDAMAAGTGRVEVVPEVSRRFKVDDKTFFEPKAGVGAFVGFDDLSALNPTTTDLSGGDVQLRAQAGFAVGVEDGTNLQATGAVESSAAKSSDNNWTGRLQLNVPLGKQ